MGFLFYPRRADIGQATPPIAMSYRYDGVKPEDEHLAVIIHCVDEEIFEWLERREAKRKNRRSRDERSLLRAFPKARLSCQSV
jgi:hypothetical protein